MGLKLRINLFYQVSEKDVYRIYTEFYHQREQTLTDNGDQFFRFELHESDNDWTVLHLDSGWEWQVRRQAQLYVSEKLHCGLCP